MIAKVIILLLLCIGSANAQGHIDHIKNQPYLQLQVTVDCNNSAGDNLSEKICANLAYQRSDSLLCVVYDSLLAQATNHYIDSLKEKIIVMQTSWRKLRDEHCHIVADTYQGCASCYLQAIDYLNCLREFTEQRITELRKLLETI